MKNMCRGTHKMCEFANSNGYCMITACKKGETAETSGFLGITIAVHAGSI